MLLVAATVLALIAAEVACRLWSTMTGHLTPGQFLVHDARLGWRNRSDFEGRHTADDFDVAVRFDAAGRRHRLGPVRPRSRRPLVLALGDSTTFGWGVEEEETFVASLRDELDADIENLAVSGYGTGQQLLSLRGALSVRTPRLVIVTHSTNDVAEVQNVYMYRRYKPRFVVEGEGVRLTNVPVPRDWLVEYSHVWRIFQKALGRFDSEDLTEDGQRAGRDLVRRLYREMRSECVSRGVRFVIVGLESAWLRDFAAAEAIPYVDLTSTVDRAKQSGTIRFEHDPHWLPRLHAAIARDLAAFVVRERLLHD